MSALMRSKEIFASENARVGDDDGRREGDDGGRREREDRKPAR